MRVNEFKEILKKDNPQHILYLHTMLKITLTNKQLDEVLALKKDKKEN